MAEPAAPAGHGASRQPVPVHWTRSASSRAGSTRRTSRTSQPAIGGQPLRAHPGAHRAGVEHADGEVGQPVPRDGRPLRRIGEVVADAADRLDRRAPPRSTSVAPGPRSRSSSWQPDATSPTSPGPGTTSTCRPSVRARRAVACAPDRAAASTTTVPRVSAAISRLRTRKRCRSGAQPGGHSLTSSPVSAIRLNSAPCAAG